jgi:hypothetical protein
MKCDMTNKKNSPVIKLGNLSVKLKNHHLPDICLCEYLSLFWFVELTVELCPRILDTPFIMLHFLVILCVNISLQKRNGRKIILVFNFRKFLECVPGGKKHER